jgi:CBS domain-containing protein
MAEKRDQKRAGTAARSGAAAARRGMKAGVEAARSMAEGMQDQAGRAAQDATKAAGAYGRTARGAAEQMQSLMNVPAAAVGGLQDISQTWTRVLSRAMEANARFSQDLMRCNTLQDVAELQGRFVNESLAGLRDGSAELVRAAGRLTERALEPGRAATTGGYPTTRGTVADVMTTDVRVAKPDDTVQEVARIMAEEDTGALPVGENDRLVGMVTDRDIAVRLAAEGKDPAKTQVREVMSTEVKYCFEDEDLEHVAENMAELQLRRLPVMNRERRLVGIISLGDLATEDAPHVAGRALSGISRWGGQHSQGAHAGGKPKRGKS